MECLSRSPASRECIGSALPHWMVPESFWALAAEANPRAMTRQSRNRIFRNLRITQINDKCKIFTAAAADGKEYRFTFQKIEGWKVGSVVDVTYTGTLGGPKPAMASNLNLSKSN